MLGTLRRMQLVDALSSFLRHSSECEAQALHSCIVQAISSMRGVCDHVQDLAAWDYNTEQMEWVRAHFYNFDRMGASAAQATHQRSHALPGMGGGFFEGCIIGPQPLLQCTRSFNTEPARRTEISASCRAGCRCFARSKYGGTVFAGLFSSHCSRWSYLFYRWPTRWPRLQGEAGTPNALSLP